MAKKGGKKKQKQIQQNVEKEDLDRFAGSSDEEEEEKQQEVMASPAEQEEHHDADVEIDTDDEDEESKSSEDEGAANNKQEKMKDQDDDDSSTSSIEKDTDPAYKMASVMGRILGGDNKKKTTTVVLGKTVTPLQKLQQQEKEKLKVLKEKRQANRERNLSALHFPLSIATSNKVQTEGRLSVAKELEQERFHRRVATRGVVALFNAISQHQRSSNQVSGDDGAVRYLPHMISGLAFLTIYPCHSSRFSAK
jgi:Rrp15p